MVLASKVNLDFIITAKGQLNSYSRNVPLYDKASRSLLFLKLKLVDGKNLPPGWKVLK